MLFSLTSNMASPGSLGLNQHLRLISSQIKHTSSFLIPPSLTEKE